MIEIGAQVVENEKIQTTATGSVQVLFIDKTTLNVGPNSTLVIDRFVFNPVTTKGELALSLGKGVLRVVGGAATHSEGATIRTPVASIGLRGGIAIITHSGAKGTEAILGFGRMSVTTLCIGSATNCRPTTVDVTRPGYGVTVAGLNKAPSSPTRASSQELAQVEHPVDEPRRPKRRGEPAADRQSGSELQRRHAQFARRADCHLHLLGGSRQRAYRRASHATDGPARVAEHRLGQNHTDRHRTVSAKAGHSAAGHSRYAGYSRHSGYPSSPPVTPGPTATYAIVTPGPFSTSAGASPVPYLTGAFAGTGGFTVSPILGYQAGGFNPGTTNIPDITSRQFQAGLSVTGQGASQNATLFVMTSEISNAPNIGYTQGGGFDAVTMRNPARWYGLG